VKQTICDRCGGVLVEAPDTAAISIVTYRFAEFHLQNIRAAGSPIPLAVQDLCAECSRALGRLMAERPPKVRDRQ
jgi:hypothetical protein